MSPHYKIEIDLTNEPMKDNVIMDDTIWDDIEVENFYEIRDIFKIGTLHPTFTLLLPINSIINGDTTKSSLMNTLASIILL
jgi:hypothetical protein